jgi:hypothetical protein
MNEASPFSYRLFGFHIASDVELPELPAVPLGGPADAEIRFGRLQCNGSAELAPQPVEGGATFSIPEVARYAVLDGRRIVVDPVDGADARNVRLYLLGSAMGLLLHQRGVLPLHANAVDIEGCAVAFMGPSGAGKSTLAAWLHDEGLRIVADDVCAVRFDEASRPVVSQGLPRLRLWKSALEATGRTSDGFERSYAGDDEWDKFDVPLQLAGDPAAALPLAAIYVLASGDELAIEARKGVAAAEAIFANTYRGQYIDGAEQARAHWEACLKLIAITPIFSVSRRWGFDEFDDQARRIVDHARGLIGGGDG